MRRETVNGIWSYADIRNRKTDVLAKRQTQLAVSFLALDADIVSLKQEIVHAGRRLESVSNKVENDLLDGAGVHADRC
jgi:hypothetical protein